MPITHSTVVVVADDGTSPVGSDEWNDDHTLPDHSELGNIGTDDHHAKSHTHNADGSGNVAHSSLTGIGNDDHHAKSHTHNGDGSGNVAHSSLASVGTDDHHNKQHALNDAAHHTGTLDDSQIPSSIARDSEVTSAISTHEGLSDPHTGYRLESADHNHSSTGAQGGNIAFSGATVSNSGVVSSSSGIGLALTADTEAYDTASYHSTGSNTSRLVAPVTGYYHVVTWVSWAANTASFRQVSLEVNGNAVAGAGTQIALAKIHPSQSGSTQMVISADVLLTAGDYVETFSIQSAGTLNVLLVRFSMHLIGV